MLVSNIELAPKISLCSIEYNDEVSIKTVEIGG